MKSHKYFLLLIVSLSSAGLTYRAVSQTTYDWLDSAPDGYWRQGASQARWSGGYYDEPPSNGILMFNNNHQLNMNNNVPDTYALYGIVFGVMNTNDRTISGNTVRFFDYGGNDPTIRNISTGSHTISFNIEGDGDVADPLEINPVEGNLTISGKIDNKGSGILVYGNNGKSLSLTNSISGAGGISNLENSVIYLSANNTYQGTTSVTNGTIVINGNQSSATGDVSVGVSGKLGGYGTVGGATTVSGTHNVSNSGSDRTQNFSSSLTYNSNSIFSWDLDSAVSDPGANASNQGPYDQVVVGGALTGTSIFQVVLASGSAFANAFWNTDKSWNNIFSKGGGSSTLASIFTTFSGSGVASDGLVSGEGQFSFSGDTLNWTAVPEPSNLLAGVLLGAGLLRRKRGARC